MMTYLHRVLLNYDALKELTDILELEDLYPFQTDKS